MVNTALTPLDPEECKEKPKAKMTRALQQAYVLASEKHDLQYYKDMLVQWQKEEQEIAKETAELQRQADEKAAKEAAAKEAAEAAKAAEAEEGKEKKKKKPRKSKGGDEDVEMEDADAPKSTKKRKKDAESDAEGVKVRFGHSMLT
jgi:septal ring factor EnvC (AmiA/AmiB activator)